MALLEEQFTETLDAGAPDITYQGNEGKEQKIARQLWDQLPNQVRMQFGSFEQFFQSGAWKEVLARLQQAQEQTPERIQETETIEEQPQQGLASMMPAQMADGGMLMASASDPMDDRNQISYHLFGKGLHELTPDEEMMLDDWLEDKAQKWQGAYGGIAGADGRRAYGLGSIFKKITKPIKKLVKSPVGKAAAVYGLGTMLGGMPAFGGTAGKWGLKDFGSRLLSPGGGSGFLNLFKPGQWGQGNLLNPLLRKSKDIVKAGETIKEWGDPSWAKILGAGATVAPFAMSAAGKWDTGEQEIDNLKAKAAEFGFDYNQMIQDLQAAVATGSEAELAKVLSNYNLSRSDMSAAPYIGTAAEGGRIGYAGGGILNMLRRLMTPEAKRFKQFEFSGGNLSSDKEMILNDIMEEMSDKIYGKPYGNLNKKQQMKISDAASSELFDIQAMEGDAALDRFKEGWAQGGRIGAQEGGLMSLGGMEMDLRGGGFVPLGAQEKADDVPARLSKNEFVFTADAVRAAGDGDVDAGADKMYNTMKQLENRVG